MGEPLDEFCDQLDEDNDWPVIEGFRIAPSDALSSNSIYFADAYSAWAQTDEGPEVFNLGADSERDDDFDAYVNNQSPHSWQIDGFEIPSADALATDPDRYEEARRRWRAQRWREQDELITAEFPSPIALRFGRFLANHRPERKLAWLQSSWEATAILFTSLALCEARHYEVDASSCPLTPGDDLKGFWNLRTVKIILDALIDRDVDVPTLSRLRNKVRTSSDIGSPPQAVKDVDLMRGQRNDSSHMEPMNDARAMALVDEYERMFREKVLDHLELLKDLTLFSYERDASELQDEEDGLNEAAEPIEIWPYRGLVTEKKAHEYWYLGDADRLRVKGRTHPDRDVYACSEETSPILLSPYITWVSSEEGHARYLAYLARVTGKRGSRVFEYLVFGDTKRHKCAGRQLERDLESLHCCFRGEGTPSKNEQQKRFAATRRSVSNRAARSSTVEATDGKESTE